MHHAALATAEGFGERHREVHAGEPVGPGSAQAGMVERQGLFTGQELAQGFLDGGVIERAEPQPLDRTPVSAELHHLAGDHFALAIGVGGHHNLRSLFQQL